MAWGYDKNIEPIMLEKEELRFEEKTKSTEWLWNNKKGGQRQGSYVLSLVIQACFSLHMVSALTLTAREMLDLTQLTLCNFTHRKGWYFRLKRENYEWSSWVGRGLNIHLYLTLTFRWPVCSWSILALEHVVAALLSFIALSAPH